MGWFRRRKEQFQGYEDRAALKGFGGYEPAEPTPPTVGASPHTPAPPEPDSSAGPALPEAPEALPPRRARRRSALPPPSSRLLGFVYVVGFGVVSVVVSLNMGSEQEATSVGASEGAAVAPRRTPETRVVVSAVVDGWQPVADTDVTYAYDVPPGWEPRPGTVHGWESSGSRFTLVASAFVGEGFCELDENVQRGGSGLTSAAGGDTVAAATETAEELARHAYTPDGGAEPDVEVVEQRSVEASIEGRDREATLVLAEVTVSAPGEQCLPGMALVGALAIEVPSAESTPVLVAYDGQDGPGVTSEDDITRLLTSLRTVPEDELETTVVTPTR